jgi:hypothetical protein
MNFPAFVGFSIILAITALIVGLVAHRVYKRKGRTAAVLTAVILAPLTFFVITWAWLFVAMYTAISLGKFSP